MKTRPLVAFLLFAASITFAASPSPISTASPPASPSATAAQPRNLKPEDFAALRDVDEPNISPDGNFIAYVVKTADMEKDKLPGNLWLAKWDGSENRALTFGNKGQRIRAGVRMENGSRSFPAAKTKTRSISFGSCRPAVAKRRRSPSVKGGVEDFAWAPDSKRIVLVVRDPIRASRRRRRRKRRPSRRWSSIVFTLNRTLTAT